MAVYEPRLSQQFTPNVIIFGETGVGKSSVVNLILGSAMANVSTSANGETFKSTVYPVDIDGKPYSLHDTVGLGEHSSGMVDGTKAVQNLYRLVTCLSSTGGINLLVFIIKCGRITEAIHKNYILFHKGFCDSEVPIVIVVTRCEDIEPRMDRWWMENEPSFTRAGMLFDGHACVCASKGRRTPDGLYLNEDLVKTSAKALKGLIVEHCTLRGWEKPPVDWYKKILGFVVDPLRSSKIPTIFTHLARRLINAFSPSEVEEIIAAVLRENESTPNVVIFGETGAGNSSVISMILGSGKVKVTDGALKATFKSTAHAVEIDGKAYNLHDTVLGEHGGGIAENTKAVQGLYRLVVDLYNAGGINLLIFVFKCDRPPEGTYKSCSLLHHLCDTNVPIVTVGTDCRNVGQRICSSSKWIDNKGPFKLDRKLFQGHACVAASIGSERTNGDLQLPEVVERLIIRHCLSNSWTKPSSTFGFFRFFTSRSPKIPTPYDSLNKRLKESFSKAEVRAIINAISGTTSE